MFTFVLIVCSLVALSLTLVYPWLINRQMKTAKRQAEALEIAKVIMDPDPKDKTWIEEELEKRRPKEDEEAEEV